MGHKIMSKYLLLLLLIPSLSFADTLYCGYYVFYGSYVGDSKYNSENSRYSKNLHEFKVSTNNKNYVVTFSFTQCVLKQGD